MKRKISLLLVMAMILSMSFAFPLTASAEGEVCEIGDTQYMTLQAAVNAVPTGISGNATTITLIGDVAHTGDLTILNKKIDIDMNGFALALTGNLTLGQSTGNNAPSIVKIYGGVLEAYSVRLAKGSVAELPELKLSGDTNGQLNVAEGATVTVNGNITGGGGYQGLLTANGKATVNGNLYATDFGGVGVYVSLYGNAEVYGNVTAVGDNSKGVYARLGGKAYIKGDVFGARYGVLMAYGTGSEVTIDGTLSYDPDNVNGPAYISFNSNFYFEEDDYTEPSNKAGYLMYTHQLEGYTAHYVYIADPTPVPVDSPKLILTGGGTVVQNGQAAFTVSVSDMDRLATATLWIEVDGKYLAGTDNTFTGLSNFSVLGSVNWELVEGDTYVARVTLINSGDISGAADILSLVFGVKEELGASHVKITKAVLSGYDEDDEAVFIDFELDGVAAIDVTQYYSNYDVNRDGKVDQLDLTTAQRYYGAEEGDDNWDAAQLADVNLDGLVDIQDYIDILLHIEW